MRASIAALILALLAASATARAEDADGKALFKQQCGTCHTAEKGGGKRQGPNLFGVVGRPAGSLAGFAYSPAFAGGKDGLVWDSAALDRWIENPQQVIPGVVMAYKQPDAALRARLIDYLETLK
jgi:cytochrome c